MEATTSPGELAPPDSPAVTDRELFRAFVGPNAEIYEAKLDQLEAKDPALKRAGTGWSWPAFVVPLPWLMYRKLWGAAAALTFLPIAIGLLLPNNASATVMGVLVGLFGKSWYTRTAARKVRTLSAQTDTRENLVARARRAGGVSKAGAVLGGLIMVGGITAMFMAGPDQGLADCNQQSDWTKRIDGCSKIIETGASEAAATRSAAHLNRGIAHQHTGALDKAVQDYNEAIQLDPRNALAYNNRASVLVGSDLPKAVADASEALRLDPKLALAYANRSLAQVRSKNFDAASADANRALELDPKLQLAYLTRSSARLQAKDFDGVIADADEALRLSPKSAWALFNRGIAHFSKGDPTRAVADLEAAMAADPAFTAAQQVLDEIRRGDPKP